MVETPLLLPAPREVRWPAGTLRLPGEPRIAVRDVDSALSARAREILRRALGGPGAAQAEASSLQLEIAPRLALPDEGFELSIRASGLRLAAGEPRGLGHALSALEQLLLQCGPNLPYAEIRDWPDFAVRGYMLDVSRDRVPTMPTLMLLLDLLASLRLNQLQIYTEHTFAYARHETVWRDASPLRPEQIRELDRECAQRGIELVANQNSFGHMERWLRHPQYRHLAELTEGGRCLAPGSESLAFMRELYAELLPCFRSRRINIGGDETWDLGRGRSAQACEQRGRGRVYLEFLLELMRGLHADGRHVEFWGDIISQHSELIGELPREGITALAWGYEAPSDPAALPESVRARFAQISDLDLLRGFEHAAAPFARSGVPFHVCPGTSSWNSLVGRWPNARGNLRDAAVAGKRHGASGYLITDWGDNGHLQPPSVSLLPLAYGAAVSWCAQSAESLPLERALDVLVLRDSSGECARALVQLGELGAETKLGALNASPLFLGLIRPLGSETLTWGDVRLPALNAVVERLDEARQSLACARPGGFGGELVVAELRQAAALARHGAWRLARGKLAQGPTVAQLRSDLAPLIEQQASTWRARSREGGLADSLERLRRAAAEYD